MKRSQTSNIRLIVSKRSYSTPEIARILGVHARTVQAWHKEGLSAIDENSKPFLFMGEDIRRFLLGKRNARRIKLGPGQFYCPRCRAARSSDPENITINPTGKRIGKDDEFVMVKGICEKCGCRLTRFSTKSLANLVILPRKAKRGKRILEGNLSLPLYTDIERGETGEK